MTSSSSAPKAPTTGHAAAPARGTWARRLVAALLIISGILTFVYAAASMYIATQVVKQKPLALAGTPAQFQLDYRDVVFPARDDHLLLRGWFIPGVLPNGQQTTQRPLIRIHGSMQNPPDPPPGPLALSTPRPPPAFAR